MAMQTHELVPHAAFPPDSVRSVKARIGIVGTWLQLRWRVEGSAKLVIPPFAGRHRADELWRTTCFELFAQARGQDAYCELNLAPSEAWAAYDFSEPREGMTNRRLSHDPVITPRNGRDLLIFDAAMPLSDLPALPLDYGLTCVIEEEGGILSYWAMAHGDVKPDFHDPSCFAGSIAAPEQP